MARALQPAGLYGISYPGGGGQYAVGPNRPYPDIQAAIEALYADQGPDTFSAPQEIVVDTGIYAPFRIEPDMFRPTAENRLTIRAAVGGRPVVSGRVDPDRSDVGAMIGNNVPYVGIDGFFFRELIKGAVFGVNSHNGRVSRTMFMQCHNVGAWFYQADECLLDNSVLINCGHGVVFTKTREATILHNTFYNDGSAYRRLKDLDLGDKTYCIFIDLQDDRGQGVEDTGTATMKNNIIMSATDWGLGLYQKDIYNLDSDYNCWYCPEGDTYSANGGIAELRVPNGDGTHWKVPVFTLGWIIPGLRIPMSWGAMWQIMTGQDYHSINDDPLFLKPSSSEESAKIDLDLFNDSPVIGKGEMGYSIPTHLTDSSLHLDFNRVARMPQAPTGTPPPPPPLLPVAIGAFAKKFARLSDDSVFPGGDNPADEEDSDLDEFVEGDCEEDIAAIDSAAQVYASAVPFWYPEVHRGQFHVRDQDYYLFKQKRGIYLKNAQRTTFSSSWILQEEGLQVTVAGKDVTDLTPWTAGGYTFTIWHSGLTDFDESSDVVVTANSRFWDDDVQGFITKSITHRWRLSDGHHQYFLPSNPNLGSPVVVTDDLVSPGNTIGLAQEFKTRYDPVLEETEILFGGPKNLWMNSDFSYRDDATQYPLTTGVGPFDLDVVGYRPKDHEIEATGYAAAVPRARISAGQEWSPVRGFYSMLLGPADSGYIAQRVKVNPENPYTFSFYASLLETGLVTGELGVALEFYDQDFTLLQTSGPFTGYVSGGPDLEAEWERLGLSFYAEPDTTVNRTSFSESAQELNSGVAMPSDTRWVITKVYPSTQYWIGLDAFQIQRGYRPTLYTRLPKGIDLTIEYEESDARFYKVEDFTIQPVRNPNARGFFSVVPIPAHHWDTDAAPYTTTLSDYKWAWGRVSLLPWAKVSGHNKYARTPYFSTTERLQFAEKVSVTPQVAYPYDIIPNPTTVIARQGTEGESFTVEVLDNDRNPYMFEWLKATIRDPNLEFPGYLAERSWSAWIQLGQEVNVQLDEGGQKTIRFIPPEPDDIEYRGPKPVIDMATGYNGSRAGHVELPYRVYSTNHGNPVLCTEDDTKIALIKTGLTANIDGTPIGDHTTFALSDFPEPGTVDVYGSITGEVPVTKFRESYSTPLRDRHYLVDYELGKITVRGDWPYGFRINYAKKLAWRDPTYPRRLYFDEEALDATTGNIIVKYDALLDLVLEALPPTGMPGVQGLKVRIDAVAQHGDRSLPWQ